MIVLKVLHKKKISNLVPPFILSVVIPRVQIECVGLFRVCFLFLTAFSVIPSRTLRKIQNFKKYEFSSEFQNFFDTHTHPVKFVDSYVAIY